MNIEWFRMNPKELDVFGYIWDWVREEKEVAEVVRDERCGVVPGRALMNCRTLQGALLLCLLSILPVSTNGLGWPPRTLDFIIKTMWSQWTIFSQKWKAQICILKRSTCQFRWWVGEKRTGQGVYWRGTQGKRLKRLNQGGVMWVEWKSSEH